jgi:hypothetical protein
MAMQIVSDVQEEHCFFPSEVNHRLGNSPWKLIKSIHSENSQICRTVNPDESNLCDFLLTKTSGGLSVRIYKNDVQDEAKTPSNWGYSQRIKWFRCSCNECPVKYQIRRITQTLAIYQAGQHAHPPRALAGLSVDAKAALNPFANQKDGAGRFLRSIREHDFPSDIRTILLNGIDESDKDAMKTFKRSCQNYLFRKNQSKKKHKVANPAIGENQSDFLKWLGSRLKNPCDLRNPDSVHPNDRQKVIVLSEHGAIRNDADMKSDQIIVTSYEMLASISKIGQYFQNHQEGILMEIDYTQGLIQDFVVGCVGVSDANRVFHPIIFEINLKEDGDGAKSALSICSAIFKRLIPSRKLKLCRVLKDGGSALSSATKSLGYRELSCLSHLIRNGWGVKKGHGSGYMGSLPTYLKSKNCEKNEIKWLTLALICLRHLPSETEYTHAVLLLRSHCIQHKFTFCRTNAIKSHVFQYYFPLLPRLNFHPGEPRSTNGLEKTLGVTKVGSREIFESLHYPTITHAFFNYVATFESKPFAILPKEYKTEWDRLIFLSCPSNNLPLRYRVATVYDFKTGRVTDYTQVLMKESTVIYCPTENYLKVCVESATTNFVREPGNSFSASMDFDLFEKCCNCNPIAMAHLLSVTWKGLYGESI